MAILDKIDALAQGEGADIPRRALANARDLLKLLPVEPFDCSRGYWPTLILHLSDAQVEVFEDRFELYIFVTDQVDITHLAHAPGEPPSPDLLAALLRLPSSRSRSPG